MQRIGWGEHAPGSHFPGPLALHVTCWSDLPQIRLIPETIILSALARKSKVPTGVAVVQATGRCFLRALHILAKGSLKVYHLSKEFLGLRNSMVRLRGHPVYFRSEKRIESWDWGESGLERFRASSAGCY